ncbi:MAG: hypothetical protein ACLPVY_11495 [Acidimicrobiia bacterium]
MFATVQITSSYTTVVCFGVIIRDLASVSIIDLFVFRFETAADATVASASEDRAAANAAALVLAASSLMSALFDDIRSPLASVPGRSWANRVSTRLSSKSYAVVIWRAARVARRRRPESGFARFRTTDRVARARTI